MRILFNVAFFIYVSLFSYTFGTYLDVTVAQIDAMTHLATINGSYIDLIERDMGTLKKERTLLASSEYALVSLFIHTNKDLRVPSSMVDPMVRAVLDASKSYSLSPAIILAVIDTESTFIPWAVSAAGCIGLMQLNPAVWELSETEDYYDIHTNIMEGTRILKYYINKFGLDHGISAYNMGSGNTNRGIINSEYVSKVKIASEKYRALIS